MIAFLMIAGLGVLALLSRLAALTRMTIRKARENGEDTVSTEGLWR